MPSGTPKNPYREEKPCNVCGSTFTATASTQVACQGRCTSRYQHLKTKYGITPQDRRDMLDAQGHVCALCSGPFTLVRGEIRTAIDHDHETGRVRGILCYTCNTGLGKLGDKPASLHRAHHYFLSTRDILGELLEAGSADRIAA